MKKNLLLIIFAVLFLCIGCTNKKTNISVQYKELQLSDFKKAEQDVTNIIGELKKTGYYDGFEFDSFKYDPYADVDQYIQVTYIEKGHESDYKNSYLHLDYDIKQNLARISLNCDNNDQMCANRKLAMIYMKRFDITENDFENTNEGDSYSTFLKIVSGTLLPGELWAVFTKEDKNLMISGNYQNMSFSISYRN